MFHHSYMFTPERRMFPLQFPILILKSHLLFQTQKRLFEELPLNMCWLMLKSAILLGEAMACKSDPPSIPLFTTNILASIIVAY